MTETQQSQENLLTVKPEPSSLSIIGVLREAFKTTRRNGRLVFSILLLVFLSSSQLELGTKLALKPIVEEVASNWPTSSFGTRSSSSSFTHKHPCHPVSSTQQANPGSSGYNNFGQSRSSQQMSPSSHSYRFYQQASPRSYGYNKQSLSSQRPNHGSYGYMDQSMPNGQIRSVRSSQQAIPGSYGYMGQFVPEVKVARSPRQANQGSYRFVDQSLPIGEVKGFRALLGMKLLILVVSCVILLFFLVASISSTYEAHTAKVMSLKDVFLRFRESWKRPIHTSFCLVLISLGLFLLFILLAMFVQILAEGSTAYILYGILAISASLSYLHMAVRWMVSLVVSVLESESSGLKAIDRAGELTKGKRIQASVLMIMFHLAIWAVHMVSNAMTKKLDGWAKMAVTIPFTIGLDCVLKLFMFVVYTVYYHDRKMNRKEGEVKGHLGLYVPIAAADEA